MATVGSANPAQEHVSDIPTAPWARARIDLVQSGLRRTRLQYINPEGKVRVVWDPLGGAEIARNRFRRQALITVLADTIQSFDVYSVNRN